MKNLSKLFFALLVTMSIFSCDKDEMNDSTHDELQQSSSQIESRGTDGDNTMAMRFSVAEATSLAVLEVRNLMPLFVRLADETEAKGYYEREFFLGAEKDASRPELGGQSIHDVLVDFGGKNMDDILKTLCQNDKGLTFLIEGETNGAMSTRVYVDDNFDESDKEAEIKYYVDGVLGSHSIDIEAVEQTVVVRQSESFFTESTAKEGGYDLNELIPIGDICGDLIFGTGGPGGGGPTGPGSDPCDCERDCIDGTENIYRFKAKHDYDSWRGKGEFIFYTILADDVEYTIDDDGYPQITGNPLSHLRNRVTGVKGDWKWNYVNFSLHIWDLDEDGDRFKVMMVEDDGKKKEFDIALSFKVDIPLVGEVSVSTSLPITINDGGDYIGDYLVNYCQDIDPNGFPYNPAAGSEAVTVRHNER